MGSIIARRYAILILHLCQKKKVLPQFEKGLSELVDFLSENRYIETFLNSPGVSNRSKKLFIDREVGNEISEINTDFLKMLVEQNHQVYLAEIYNYLQRLSGIYLLNNPEEAIC